MISVQLIFFSSYAKVWYLSKDEKTGKLFFYNQLSGQRKYEKPIGLKLLDEEQRLWDEYMLQQIEEQEKEEEAQIEATNNKIKEYNNKNKNNLKQNEADVKDDKEGDDEEKQIPKVNDQEGVIQSGWVEVTEEDNFFNKYATRNIYGDILDANQVQENEDESDDEIDEKEAAKMARIELLIEQGKIQTQQQMIEALIGDNEGGNKIKQNDKMKKLIEQNLDNQERNMKVYKKKNWLEEEEEEQNKNKQVQKSSTSIQSSQPDPQAAPKSETKGSMFKKRITNNKNVQNIPIDD